MASKHRRPLYINPSASSWTSTSIPEHPEKILQFHNCLPNFTPTPLISLSTIATEIGVKAIYIKDESARCGSRAFKILGASWAAFRAIITQTGLRIDAGLDEVSAAARDKGITLLAATAGNHGIAVASTARLLGVGARIYVSDGMPEGTREAIRKEGAELVVVEGNYDDAVIVSEKDADGLTNILIQDTAFEGYEQIPQWVVDGYSTMVTEIDHQLDGQIPDLVITPVGVGSLAQAVVTHYKSNGRATGVLAVEADASPCLWKCLRNGKLEVQAAGTTIMAGMNCSTVSSLAWPVLSAGLDACITVSDAEAHTSLQQLESVSVSAGPCGGAALAALRHVSSNYSSDLGLTRDSIVVLLCTEAPRPYEEPFDVSVSDPVSLTQCLVRIDSTNPGSSGDDGPGEGAIAGFISAWLQHRDIETHWLEKTTGRPSVLGIVRGIGGGESLMLNGHIDTVKSISYDGNPFSGDIKNGKLYGRGSYDMKAGIAASLIALAQIKVEKLHGDVLVACVADEENLSFGTEELLDAGWRADGAIVCEPTGLDVVIAHQGFVWFTVDIIGTAAHGSRYDLGVDAICKAGQFLVKLDHYGRDILRRKAHPILGTGSIHASMIKGGEEASSYPALCTITGERRTIPGDSVASVEAGLRQILDELSEAVPDFKYFLRMGFNREPFEVAKDSAFVSNALGTIRQVLGRDVVCKAGFGWADSALLADKGIPTFLIGVDGAGAHADTEYASISSIKNLTDILTGIALDFCK